MIKQLSTQSKQEYRKKEEVVTNQEKPNPNPQFHNPITLENYQHIDIVPHKLITLKNKVIKQAKS